MASVTAAEEDTEEVSALELERRELERRPFHQAFASRRLQEARRLCYNDLLSGTATRALGMAYSNILLDAFDAGQRDPALAARLLDGGGAWQEGEVEGGRLPKVLECDLEAERCAESVLEAFGQAVALAAEKELVLDGPARDVWLQIYAGFLHGRARVHKTLFMAEPHPVEHFEGAVADLSLAGEVEAEIVGEPATQDHHRSLAELFVFKTRLTPASRAQDLATADAHLERALKANSEDPELWYEKARVQEMGGNLVTAVEHFGRAVELDEEYAPAWFARGKCHLVLNNAWEAASDFGKYIEHYIAYYTIAGFDTRFTSEQLLAHGLLARATAYFRIDDLDMALSDLKRCIELGTPELSRAHFLKGEVMKKKGQWWDCVVEHTASLDAAVSIEAFAARAEAYEAIGKPEEAQRDRRLANLLRSQQAYSE